MIIAYDEGDDWSEIPSLQANGVASMIRYHGDDIDMFRKIRRYIPEWVTVNRPFAFARFLEQESLRG